MRPPSPVAHPLGKGPVGIPVPVQMPGRVEQDVLGSGKGRKLLAPSSSGEALWLSYTSLFMVFHKVLEPSSGSVSGLFRRLRSPPGLGRPCTHSPILKTNRRRRLPAAFAGLPPSPRLQKLGSLLAEPERDGTGRDVPAVTLWRHGSLGAPRALTVRLARALPPSLSPCHPRSCDAVSGLHGSDSSVELTA